MGRASTLPRAEVVRPRVKRVRPPPRGRAGSVRPVGADERDEFRRIAAHHVDGLAVARAELDHRGVVCDLDGAPGRAVLLPANEVLDRDRRANALGIRRDGLVPRHDRARASDDIGSSSPRPPPGFAAGAGIRARPRLDLVRALHDRAVVPDHYRHPDVPRQSLDLPPTLASGSGSSGNAAHPYTRITSGSYPASTSAW